MNIKSTLSKIPLSASILFLLVSMFLFIFLYTKTRDNNQTAQTNEAVWQSEASRREEIRTLDHSIKIIADEKAALESHFAQSSNIVPFLDTIEGLAPQTAAKAEVTSVEISKDRLNLYVGLTATGSFGGLYKFLKLLENSPYILSFDSVDIRRVTSGEASDKDAKAPVWELILKIKLASFINQ